MKVLRAKGDFHPK